MYYWKAAKSLMNQIIERLITISSIILWFAASSFSNVRTRQAFKCVANSSVSNRPDREQRHWPDQYCYGFFLSTLQFLVGSLCGMVCAVMFEGNKFNLLDIRCFILHGLSHNLGNCFTNICLLFGSISLT